MLLEGGRRSIPACAGEAEGIRYWTIHDRGLSPRVRGKRPGGLQLPVNPRSIPACAGEAVISLSPASLSEVYPRVCGGSAGGRAFHPWGGGLSPRVRGKPS